MAKVRLIAAAFAALMGMTGGLQAGDEEVHRELVNKATVTVLGGSLTGTYSRLVSDMASAFNDGYDFRIVPVVGQGSMKGVEDLLFLEGIDVALLQSDVLDFFAASDVYPNIRESLRYLTTLYDEEIHLVARNDIETVHDLAGKKVSFGPASSGTFLTSTVIFSRLGVDVQVVEYSNDEGLNRLKRGDIDAMVRVVGAPTRLLQGVKPSDGLHIVTLPVVEGAYFPATLTHEQYPGLIPPGQSVKTAAVGALMAAYNWPEGHPRRASIQNLVDRLNNGLVELRSAPHHKKWRQVRLERELPGWIRWDSIPVNRF